MSWRLRHTIELADEKGPWSETASATVGAQAMCQRFDHADEQYLHWLDEHRDGFVFNDYPGQRILHCAGCSHLLREDNTDRRTEYAKLCCSSRECILTAVATAYGTEGEGWHRCRARGTGCWK